MKIKIGDRVKAHYDNVCGIVTRTFDGHVEIRRDDGRRGGGRDGTWITSVEDIEAIPRNTYCGDRIKKEV